MRKNCVQLVDTSGKLLGQVICLYTAILQFLVHGDKTSSLYQPFAQVFQSLFHSNFVGFQPVGQQFFPTIHTTYKNKQKSIFNFSSY